jgi:signal transduction histidine kinase
VYWNGATRVLVFGAVVMLVAALRASHLSERQTIARLHALNDLKDTLLHAVSHDLKGPMTVILGSVQTLRRARATGQPPTDEEELLSMIETSGNKMLRLVTDLLDLDRLDRGLLEPDRRPVDLAKLTSGVVAELPSDPTRAIAQDLEPTAVAVDPAKVERIVDNLVRNAIAHTPLGTPIRVRVRPFEEGALLVVEDEGTGVPAELKDVIFEPFARGGTGPRAKGAGIGLSLVARFAELHGGRAWVTDRRGGGASFHVYLPGRLDDVGVTPADRRPRYTPLPATPPRARSA